mmetsp:Transcript_25484/g.59351  ORF Transcript_25484/g.59351 Transcript_25484/m.59351 type:complete len:225 (+) Transcript_25484:1017-1691(+)
MSSSKLSSMSCKPSTSSRLASIYALSFSCAFRSLAALAARCSVLRLRSSNSLASAASISQASSPTRWPSARATAMAVSSLCCMALCTRSMAARRSRSSFAATSRRASSRSDSWHSIACLSCDADAVGFANRARSCSAILSPWPSLGDSSGATLLFGLICMNWLNIRPSCFFASCRLSSGMFSTPILNFACAFASCSVSLRLSAPKRSFSLLSSVMASLACCPEP